MTARELRPGHVLVLRTGPVAVLKRTETHGGIELVVRPASAATGARNTRAIWFWGAEPVQVAPACGGAPPGADRPTGQVQA